MTHTGDGNRPPTTDRIRTLLAQFPTIVIALCTLATTARTFGLL